MNNLGFLEVLSDMRIDTYARLKATDFQVLFDENEKKRQEKELLVSDSAGNEKRKLILKKSDNVNSVYVCVGALHATLLPASIDKNALLDLDL